MIDHKISQMTLLTKVNYIYSAKLCLTLSYRLSLCSFAYRYASMLFNLNGIKPGRNYTRGAHPR